MQFVEYKQHLLNGKVIDPEWILKGKFFFNPENKTWVGITYDETERDYYLPDGLVILDRDGLIQRCKDIHINNKYQINTDSSDSMSPLRDMTDQEIEQMVDSIIGVTNGN
jgi:hypothetical protein